MDENNNLNENETQDKSLTYDRPASAFDTPADSGPTASQDNNATESAYNTTPVNAAADTYQNTYSSPYEANSTISTAPEVVSTGFGIASLILGILSIPCNCCYGMGILFSILGIVFGALQPKGFDGKKPGIAIGGIICSVIGIVLAVIEYIIIIIAAVVTSS